MRAEARDKSLAEQFHFDLPMEQCESSGGRAFPCPSSSWTSPVPLSHALRQAMAGADPRVLIYVTVPGILCSPLPSLFLGSSGWHLTMKSVLGWDKPSERVWVVRCKVQACHQGHKAAWKGFHPGILAQSCAGQLGFGLRKSDSLAFSSLSPLFSP